MKISVDDQEVFALTNTQKNVIKNDIHADEFDADMKRRLEWILMHKYERCFNRLKQEWEPKLRSRFSSLPTDPDALAELIFSQSDYKNRDDREKKEELIEEKANA